MGYFAEENERRRAALRARMPITAAVVDEARRLFGLGVELTGAREGTEGYRVQGLEDFERAWAEAGQGLHEAFEHAKRTVPRGRNPRL